MRRNEFTFLPNGDLEDLSFLQQLCMINGIESKLVESNKDYGQMGLEEILIVLISSAVIPNMLNVINTWFQNRKKELTIIDNNKGIEIHLESNNGKGFSDSEIEKLTSFFNK